MENSWREQMHIDHRDYIKSVMADEPEFCLKARGRYLMGQITDICDEIQERRGQYLESMNRWGKLIDRQIIAYPLPELEKRGMSLIAQAKGILRQIEGHKPDIEESDIETARNYQISRLIESRNNMARCIWHDDEKPSMSIKGNFAYCFSCGKSGDAIAVYMQVRGVDFKTAIKEMI